MVIFESLLISETLFILHNYKIYNIYSYLLLITYTFHRDYLKFTVFWSELSVTFLLLKKKGSNNMTLFPIICHLKDVNLFLHFL